ncbi:MAG: histidine kinase [Clostridiales bacterium]|nr:histidine kinase [Clostridiales bacterium]
MLNKIHDLWLGISIRKKISSYAMMVILVISLLVMFSIQLANFGLNSFNDILYDNSICYDFQEAVEQEIRSFEQYVRNRSQENREDYTSCVERTEECIELLPFDYSLIGSERYARTWNIKNSYRNYQTERDELLKKDPEDGDYIPALYHIYELQSYLSVYARRLVQVTLTEGNVTYQQRVQWLHRIPGMILCFSAAIVVVILILTRLLSNALVSPLVKMAHSSRKIAKNDFSGEDLLISNRDEMGELVSAFNMMKHSTEGYINTLKKNQEMLEMLHQEEMERVETEKQLEAAQLEFLKSQINPHFLFNTLNMISCTAKLEKADDTERMITSLGNLFRYNLKMSEQIVFLSQELKVVDDYMYIQQMRFGRRIRYERKILVDEREVRIPSFTLQQLVENAIVHGIGRKEEGGRIRVRIWQREGRVMVSVTDTGVGMSAERLTQIRSTVEEKGGRTARVGIGLGNICKRVRAMYRQGEVHIYSRENRGTVIQMVIPQAAGGQEEEVL